MGHRITSEMLFGVTLLITVLMIAGWMVYFH